MKANVKVIGYGLWVIGMLIMGMPTMAQQQEWQSTSTMQTSGSVYASPVNAVGATAVSSMATTTADVYSPAKASSGPRKSESQSGRNPGEATEGSEQSPLGDAVLPLLFMALAFGGYIAIKRRKLISNKYIGNTI